MMTRFATCLARWIVRRPLAVACAGILLAAASIGVISSRNAFDSDILNLLPTDHPAVQGLKIYNAQFTQNRELAFLLTWEMPPTDNAFFRETFVALLREQPWVQRILDKPPLETADGRSSLQDILVPLLLNLPPSEFAAAIDTLAPDSLGPRLDRLVRQTAAGSPRARFELENDPLGLTALAARPVAETISISDAFDLVSPEGDAIIVPIISNQPDTSAEACQILMQEVRRFMAEAERHLGPDGPAISVTGRSAYVDEISASMGNDITLTSIVSLLCVTALFWIGFRQFLPLIGISLLLGLTALVTMAGGALIFSQLNIVALSFCSILFGLGDDFSLLLCQRFFQARNAGFHRESAIAEAVEKSQPGIFWVALTTGVGFLALCLSGSQGFAQLGVLVALGVLLCAVFMPVFLFFFIRHAPPQAAATGPAHHFARRSRSHPGRILGPAGVVFILAAITALLPWRPLGFDISPASLEPRNIPAARTLAAMMEKFPATFEPVMVVLETPDRTQLAALDTALTQLQTAGLIESSSSPSALVLDPATAETNRRSLESRPLQPALQLLTETATTHGLQADVLRQSTAVLTALADPVLPHHSWSDFLPPTSPWWFLLDRMVAPGSGAAIAYLKVPASTTPAQRKHITEVLSTAVPGARVTGWSQALAALIPWAQRELMIFGGAVALLILLILAAVYRDLRLWSLHVAALLAAAAGTVATLKLLNAPINLLNVLAFPLMLAVGVDYGTHLLLAAREKGDALQNLSGVIKPITLSGLTTATGFGALMLAQNPALSGLGRICAVGVLWCLIASLFIIVPGALLTLPKKPPAPPPDPSS